MRPLSVKKFKIYSEFATYLLMQKRNRKQNMYPQQYCEEQNDCNSSIPLLFQIGIIIQQHTRDCMCENLIPNLSI